jgi:hypothetical protein
MRIVFELETLKPMIDAVEHITNGGTPTFLIETTLNRLEYQLEGPFHGNSTSRSCMGSCTTRAKKTGRWNFA